MLLGGMGRERTSLSLEKCFAGLYALFAGLVVIAVAGLLLGPGVSPVHDVHWDDAKKVNRPMFQTSGAWARDGLATRPPIALNWTSALKKSRITGGTF